jgi:hypothetical protein
MYIRIKNVLAITALVPAGVVFAAVAKDVPAELPDPNRHPEMAGNVASVDIRGMGGGGYHYGNNGATCAKVGDSMGRAMVKLLEEARTKGKKE